MADWITDALPGGCPANPALAFARLAGEAAMNRGGLKLASPAFEAGGELDPCFTADEEDAVAPPLEWTAPPPGTQEMVIVVEDAHSDGPTCHWLVWGLPPQRGKLLEGEVPPRVGKNSAGNSEWMLPDLPRDGDPHCFVFQLFALDLPLTLMPGAKREDLLREMTGHVTAASVVTARYQATEAETWVDTDEDDFA